MTDQELWEAVVLAVLGSASASARIAIEDADAVLTARQQRVFAPGDGPVVGVLRHPNLEHASRVLVVLSTLHTAIKSLHNPARSLGFKQALEAATALVVAEFEKEAVGGA